VLVTYVLQHGTCCLRSWATESLIEFVDAHGVVALVASEGHAARVFVDRVHHAQSIPLLFSTLCDRNHFPVTIVCRAADYEGGKLVSLLHILPPACCDGPPVQKDESCWAGGHHGRPEITISQNPVSRMAT
jgi:hypothetical protein